MIIWNCLRKDVDEVTRGKLQTAAQVIAPIVQADMQVIAPIVNATQIKAVNITTTETGFFSYLGSLINRVTNLLIQNININGTITFEGSNSTYTIRTMNDNDVLRIFSGNHLNSAPKIRLFGINSNTNPGDVVIGAGNISGGAIRLMTGEGNSENRIVIQSGGDIILSDLNGTGNDYLCIASNGRLFRSNITC